jgi:hypothetical protein
MKKLLVTFGFVGSMAFAGAAKAQEPVQTIQNNTNSAGYGMAGCGLGSLLFGNDNSKFMQILAATTNGTFWSQTFGITSGTSNCVQGGVVTAQKEQAAFAEVNFQDLKRNMAAGGGEFLSSFATLLGCEDGAKASLAAMTQSRYEAIFPAANTSPMQMLGAVKAEIQATPALAARAATSARLLASRGKAKANGPATASKGPKPPSPLR